MLWQEHVSHMFLFAFGSNTNDYSLSITGPALLLSDIDMNHSLRGLRPSLLILVNLLYFVKLELSTLTV